MNKLLASLLSFSFYLHVLLGILMNLIDKTEYDFPPNMGYIIIFGLLTILSKMEINKE
jgi:hypothetical protein